MNFRFSPRNPIVLGMLALALVVLGVSGFLLLNNKPGDRIEFPLLANRVQADNPNELKINFSSLRTKLRDYVQSLENDGSNVSVYFEYLPTGVSININPENKSVAASLMKVPVVMSMYKAAELGKVDLDKPVALRDEWLNSEYGTLYQKGAGYELTLRQAAELTLKDSDNTALLMIWSETKGTLSEEEDALHFMDIEFAVAEDKTAIINAKSYSSIIKCLYFACYNSKEYSQEMLGYLVQSSFNDRLERYLPKDLSVAHKIGTFNSDYQSDCGLVYLEHRNYVLCVMVKGGDPEASDIIADISQKVFLDLSEQTATAKK